MQPEVELRGGTIIDGSGRPGYRGCLDLADGIITSVGGPERPAGRIIDASGMIVCPGQIDAHTHADLVVDSPQEMECFLSQGVTGCIVGNCGFSAFPLRGSSGRAHLRYASGILGNRGNLCGWSTFRDYAEAMEARMPLNVASLVGHGALRSAVVESGGNLLDARQLDAMCELLDAQLQQGAIGMSLGLIYSPGSTASRVEILALARVVQSRGKIMTVHLRDEGALLCQSMQEMFSIARESGVHLHLSHHKVMGVRNWGGSEESLSLIQRARQEGLRVTLDAYPYDAGCSTAMVLLPPWVLADGFENAFSILQDPAMLKTIQRDLAVGIEGWENLSASCTWENLIVSSTASGDQGVRGKAISQLAKEWNCDSLAALAGLIVRERGAVNVTIRGMSRRDVDRIMCWPDSLLGSDGLFLTGSAHPRRYGSFAHFFNYYVTEKKLLTAEAAIAKTTGQTASVFGLPGRGLLCEGYQADVAVFRPEVYRDYSDFNSPEILAGGMEYVFVNGIAVYEHGRQTGRLPGTMMHSTSIGVA